MSDAGSYKSDAEDTMHSTSTPIRDMVGIYFVTLFYLNPTSYN